MAHSVLSALMLRAFRHPWTTILVATTLGYLSLSWSDQIILSRSDLSKPSNLMSHQSSPADHSAEPPRAHLKILKKRAGSVVDPQGQDYGTNQGQSSLNNPNSMQNNNNLNNNDQQSTGYVQSNNDSPSESNYQTGNNLGAQKGLQNNNNLATQDGSQNNNNLGTQNGLQNNNNLGTQDGSQNNNNLGTQNGLQNNNNLGTQDGSQNSNNLGTQDGSQNNNNLGTQNGLQNNDNLGTQDGSQNNNNLGTQNGLQNNNNLGAQNGLQNNNNLGTQSGLQNSNNMGNSRNSLRRSFGQFPPSDPQCQAMPMEEGTWKTLQMDDYMQKIPDGKTMSLEDFAVKMKYTNFICGIGASCWAGQPCYPLGLKDFYILYSVQQYNTYMNVYADAVGYGIGMVQSTINALIASLFPAQDTTMIKNMKANMGVQAAFSQVTGAVLLDLFSALTVAAGPIGMAFNVLGQVIVAGMATAAVVIQEPPGPLKDGFDQWSNVAYYLTQYQQLLRKQIDDTLKKRIQSGISSDDGMFGVIKGGGFLPPAKMISLPDFTDRVRNITTAMGINLILNRSNAYITVGSGCQDKGLNGASEDPTRLSYCRKPGGTMYNVAIASGDDSWIQIENANVIRDSFGYSPELIIMSSVRCQKLNRGYRYNPWADGKSTPRDVTDTCVFNLPVCFLDHKDTRDRITREFKRFSPAKACKMEGMPLL